MATRRVWYLGWTLFAAGTLLALGEYRTHHEVIDLDIVAAACILIGWLLALRSLWLRERLNWPLLWRMLRRLLWRSSESSDDEDDEKEMGMAGKAGGRLVFGRRQEYQVTPVYDSHNTVIGYRVYCLCALGYHYLAYDAAGNLIERTASFERPAEMFNTYAAAQAAIEQWQRQHDAAQRASGESSTNGD